MRNAAILALILTALAVPAAAQEGADGGPDGGGVGGPGDGLREGLGLIQEGTRLLLRGLADEIDPMLRDLQERMGDLSAYHPPEILPNGDILIRRRTPRPPAEDGPRDDEVDL